MSSRYGVIVIRKLRQNETFNMRIDNRIKNYLETLADLEGLTSSGFLRMLILEKRNRVRNEMMRLGVYNGELN